MEPIEIFVKSFANVTSLLKVLTEEGYHVLISFDKNSSLFHISALQASKEIISFGIKDSF